MMNSKQLYTAKQNERDSGNFKRAEVIGLINDGFEYNDIFMITNVPKRDILDIADQYFNCEE